MRKKGLLRYSKIMLFAVSLAVLVGGASTAMAISSSTNYQVTETQFSGGSSLQSCSTQYCAQATIGDVTDGSPTSSSSATFEDIVDNQPLLDVIIEPGESNLGVLTTERTATKTTTIRIRNYLSGGYALQIMGESPKFEGHALFTPTTPTLSSPGIEQFGINAVANTAPSVGADPLQVPADQAVFGVVNDNYKTANHFMYTSGGTIAHSELDSGRTDYTVSMIVNVASTTPAGHYSGDFSAIVVPAY